MLLFLHKILSTVMFFGSRRSVPGSIRPSKNPVLRGSKLNSLFVEASFAETSTNPPISPLALRAPLKCVSLSDQTIIFPPIPSLLAAERLPLEET